jgi:hypothetical protein
MFGKKLADVFEEEGFEPLLKLTRANTNVNDETACDIEELNHIFNIYTDVADIVHW